MNNSVRVRAHVDAKHHGPSAAIAFGDYTGGRLWTLREGGPDRYPVTQRMRGYEHFVEGTELRGTL